MVENTFNGSIKYQIGNQTVIVFKAVAQQNFEANLKKNFDCVNAPEDFTQNLMNASPHIAIKGEPLSE